jgi:hypothetical protein
MRLLKTILFASMALALAVYAIDVCSAAVMPSQMMQCCKTMPCGPQHHGKNCCQTMPSQHAPFLQAASIEKTAALAQLATVPSQLGASILTAPVSAVMVVSHAPPISPPVASLSPLRI